MAIRINVYGFRVHVCGEQMEHLYTGSGKVKVKTMCEVAERLKKMGREEGIEEGKILTLIDLVQEGELSIERAAQRMGMTVEAFEKKMKFYM